MHATTPLKPTAEAPPRRIAYRTRGHSQGSITRLVSPSDVGELIKPFVFLDYFDIDPRRMPAIGFHPHSGIATVTVVLEGQIFYEETSGTKGIIDRGVVEWMRASGGVWHTGGVAGSARAKGFQLWIALPPEMENIASEARYLGREHFQSHGPARVILGRLGEAASKVPAPAVMNYLDVALKKGEKWRYDPPGRHTVAWIAVHRGKLATPEIVGKGELAAFEEANGALEFDALEERGGQALAEEGRRVRRLSLRHGGIQPQHPGGAQERSRLRVYRVEPQGRGLCRLRQRRGGAGDRATEAHVRGAADGPDAYRSAYPGRRFHGGFDAGQGPEGAFVPRAELEDHARRAAMVGERVDGRAVLPGLSEDGVLSFDGSDLLEEPLLEHLNFSQTLGAVRIHDEVRASRGHAPGKKPNQPAGFQVRCDERCTRQGDTEARNGGRKQQRLVAVPLSLTGVAVVQADRLKPDGPRLPLIVKERHFEEVAGCPREPATPERRAAYRNKLLVIELDGSQPGPRTGAEPHCHVDLIVCEIR